MKVQSAATRTDSTVQSALVQIPIPGDVTATMPLATGSSWRNLLSLHLMIVQIATRCGVVIVQNAC